MSTTIETPPESRSLEDELHEVESAEKRFEARLQKSQIAVAVAAFGALILAVAALVVALANKSDHTSVTMGATAPAARHPSGAPAGMMGADRSAATSRTINVQLGEMFARPSATSITAGKVTFVASNDGKLVHELMVERMPVKMDAPGKPHEEAAMGMIQDMQPGASGKMTLKLKPGTYELFCNVSGHYAAGQHTAFTVTKS